MSGVGYNGRPPATGLPKWLTSVIREQVSECIHPWQYLKIWDVNPTPWPLERIKIKCQQCDVLMEFTRDSASRTLDTSVATITSEFKAANDSYGYQTYGINWEDR